MEIHIHTCPNCDADVVHGAADEDVSCSDFDQEIKESCMDYEVKFPERKGKVDTTPLEESDEE